MDDAQLHDHRHPSMHAHNDKDFDTSGQHFAKAVTILGISTIQAILLRGQGKAIIARGARLPKCDPMDDFGLPSANGRKSSISRPQSLGIGREGETLAYGEIRIARNIPIEQQRANISMSSYHRSALPRYLEEALAEGYSRLRMYGLIESFGALRFPLDNGYVTVSTMTAEGTAVGSIISGGTMMTVRISYGKMPNDD